MAWHGWHYYSIRQRMLRRSTIPAACPPAKTGRHPCADTLALHARSHRSALSCCKTSERDGSRVPRPSSRANTCRVQPVGGVGGREKARTNARTIVSSPLFVDKWTTELCANDSPHDGSSRSQACGWRTTPRLKHTSVYIAVALACDARSRCRHNYGEVGRDDARRRTDMASLTHIANQHTNRGTPARKDFPCAQPIKQANNHVVDIS